MASLVAAAIAVYAVQTNARSLTDSKHEISYPLLIVSVYSALYSLALDTRLTDNTYWNFSNLLQRGGPCVKGVLRECAINELICIPEINKVRSKWPVLAKPYDHRQLQVWRSVF